MTVSPATDPAQEFPEHKDRIHTLKSTDAHFSIMLTEYHEVIHQINRVEQEIETVSDQAAEAMKKNRLRLKDALLHILNSKAA